MKRFSRKQVELVRRAKEAADADEETGWEEELPELPMPPQGEQIHAVMIPGKERESDESDS